jgi:hypothetical protein
MKVRRSIRFSMLAVAVLVLLVPSLRAQAPEGPMRPEGGGMGRGQGIHGTVMAVFPNYLTLKTEEGDTYKVNTGANTRIFKDRAPAKTTDIHPGDMLMIGGEIDAKEKTVGAAFIAVVDAERVRKMREDLGKTWVGGKITAIDETKITIQRIDGMSQTISVDENTSFRKRRESITLADIKVGDNVTARGQVKDGVFVAAELGVGGQGMMGMGGGPGRRGGGGGMGPGGADTSDPNPPGSPK